MTSILERLRRFLFLETIEEPEHKAGQDERALYLEERERRLTRRVDALQALAEEIQGDPYHANRKH